MAAVKKENTFTLKTENKNRNTATAVVVLAVVILGVKLVKKAVHRRGSSAQGH